MFANDYRERDGFNRTCRVIAGGYKLLTNDECIRNYSTTFVSEYHDVVLVTEPVNRTSGPSTYALDNFRADQVAHYPHLSPWFCPKSFSGVDGRPARCDGSLPNPASWFIYGRRIRHCLAEKSEAKCTLNLNICIMFVVLFCNAFKTACMYRVFQLRHQHSPLVTIGDAVNEFLIRRDKNTSNNCLTSKTELKEWEWETESEWEGKPKERQWMGTGNYWFHAAPAWLWWACGIL